MISMKRLLAVFAVVALIAAACGGDDATDETTTTAGDVTTTTEAMMDFEGISLAAPSCDYGGTLSSITAVDELTVEFELCSPDVAFPSKVAFSALNIHPEEYLESTGGGGTLIENPVGTGPYQLKEWDRGNQLVLESYDGYWGNAPEADTLVFRWSSEAAQRLVELQAGTVDGIDNPGRDDFAVIQGDGDLQLLEREGTNIFYLGLNRDKEPFDDELVRQAIAQAIDRDRIVENFYPPGSSVADQFLPTSIFGYTPEPTWWDFNPDAAKALLAEAGFPNGFEVTLNYRDVVRSYLPSPLTVGQDIQSQLAEIGVTVNIEVMESGAFLDASDAGELTMYMLGWGADFPDAINFLDFHFGRGASGQFGAGFEDIWAGLDEGATTADPAKRLEIYEGVTGLIKQHVPMVPIAHGGSGAAYRADVANCTCEPARQRVLRSDGPRRT